MEILLDAGLVVISLAFLSALGLIAGLAIPGLFLVVVAPWLDRLLPVRSASDEPAPEHRRGPAPLQRRG